MSIWELVTLDKLGNCQLGKQFHKPKYDPCLFENGHIPFVQGQHVNGKLYVNSVEKYYNEFGLKQSLSFPGDTVCITSGTRIESAILKFSSCLSSDLWGFNSFELVSDPVFIKYCFNFSEIQRQLVAISSVGRKYLSLERLFKVPFPKPLLDIQQKIGRILSTYDLLIENYEKQIDLLKNQRTKEPSCLKDDSYIINFPRT
ncbi:hypothetical protein A6V39_03165 [Candidatus Mycoplasma haematobovis]|uniref:Type I restriction modification DNA specificity domain-containing protein n=1 Tax=Candidatus Mycoplasma haematobovis TaxID=432608 RepID=A0A1A9QFC7_9MOLU|nr:restriction endonuclease subunit S [Candidatus Mycoplasma haematobovis]OAL10409.1 hypothetical protein A6V39_03165 [Candidatus Mycoplasma haematobovis]